MAVKHNPVREAELDARWNEVRRDLIAEYHLLTLDRNAEDCMVSIGRPSPSEGEGFLTMVSGVPVICVEAQGDRGFSFIGDSMGSGDESVRNTLEGEFAYKGKSRYVYIDRFLGNADETRTQFDRVMKGFTAEYYPKEDFKELMFRDLLTDDRNIDRAAFYAATKYMDRKELFDISEELRTRVRDLFLSDPAAMDPDGRRVASENISVAERELGRSFSDWHRLGGRLDWRVVNLAAHHGEVSAKHIAVTAEWALNSPEYAAYRENISGWVKSRCQLFSISTMKLQNYIDSPVKNQKKTNINEIKI